MNICQVELSASYACFCQRPKVNFSIYRMDENQLVIDGNKNTRFQKQNDILINKEILKEAFRNGSINMPQIECLSLSKSLAENQMWFPFCWLGWFPKGCMGYLIRFSVSVCLLFPGPESEAGSGNIYAGYSRPSWVHFTTSWTWIQ